MSNSGSFQNLLTDNIISYTPGGTITFGSPVVFPPTPTPPTFDEIKVNTIDTNTLGYVNVITPLRTLDVLVNAANGVYTNSIHARTGTVTTVNNDLVVIAGHDLKTDIIDSTSGGVITVNNPITMASGQEINAGIINATSVVSTGANIDTTSTDIIESNNNNFVRISGPVQFSSTALTQPAGNVAPMIELQNNSDIPIEAVTGASTIYSDSNGILSNIGSFGRNKFLNTPFINVYSQGSVTGTPLASNANYYSLLSTWVQDGASNFTLARPITDSINIRYMGPTRRVFIMANFSTVITNSDTITFVVSLNPTFNTGTNVITLSLDGASFARTLMPTAGGTYNACVTTSFLSDPGDFYYFGVRANTNTNSVTLYGADITMWAMPIGLD